MTLYQHCVLLLFHWSKENTDYVTWIILAQRSYSDSSGNPLVVTDSGSHVWAEQSHVIIRNPMRLWLIHLYVLTSRFPMRKWGLKYCHILLIISTTHDEWQHALTLADTSVHESTLQCNCRLFSDGKCERLQLMQKNYTMHVMIFCQRTKWLQSFIAASSKVSQYRHEEKNTCVCL